MLSNSKKQLTETEKKKNAYFGIGLALITLASPITVLTNIPSLKGFLPSYTEVPLGIGIWLGWLTINFHAAIKSTRKSNMSPTDQFICIMTVLKRKMIYSIFFFGLLYLSNMLAINTVTKKEMLNSMGRYDNDKKLNSMYNEKKELIKNRSAIINQNTIIENTISEHTKKTWSDGAKGGRLRAEDNQDNLRLLNTEIDSITIAIKDYEKGLKETGSLNQESYIRASHIFMLGLSLTPDQIKDFTILVLSLANDLLISLGATLVKRARPQLQWSMFALLSKTGIDKKKFLEELEKRKKVYDDDMKLSNLSESIGNLSEKVSEKSIGKVSENIGKVSGRIQKTDKNSTAKQKKTALINICKLYHSPEELPYKTDIIKKCRENYGIVISYSHANELLNKQVIPYLFGDNGNIGKNRNN